MILVHILRKRKQKWIGKGEQVSVGITMLLVTEEKVWVVVLVGGSVDGLHKGLLNIEF